MTTNGYPSWAQPLFGSSPVLDGIAMSSQTGGHLPHSRTPTSQGLNFLGTAARTVIMQADFVQPTFSNAPTAFAWDYDQDSADEAEWRLLDRVNALGRPVFFIPYDTVSEVWTLAAGASTLQLFRPVASSKLSTFQSLLYPNRAYVTDIATGTRTEYTIVSGAPSAGEIQIDEAFDLTSSVGFNVVTPSLAGGDSLEIIYYPAYPVGVGLAAHELVEHNRLVRPVRIVEISKQRP